MEMLPEMTSGRGPAGTLGVVGNVGECGREPPVRVVGSCFLCMLGGLWATHVGGIYSVPLCPH